MSTSQHKGRKRPLGFGRRKRGRRGAVKRQVGGDDDEVAADGGQKRIGADRYWIAVRASEGQEEIHVGRLSGTAKMRETFCM